MQRLEKEIGWCPDPIGGQAIGGGALTMPIRVLLVSMYYSQSFWLSTWC